MKNNKKTYLIPDIYILPLQENVISTSGGHATGRRFGFDPFGGDEDEGTWYNQ